MKTARWQVLLGLSLVLLSGTVYLVHYGIFGDAHHIFIYLVGDIAFVPIEVLLVTLIIHRLLSEREKQGMLKKMNMVIGAFFSEVGTGLLERFQRMDADSGGLGRRLQTMSEWTRRQFRSASAGLAGGQRQIDARAEDLRELRAYLAERRGFLLALLGNPNLLEHESFTDLLWAVFHLTEELVHRGGFEDLPETDLRGARAAGMRAILFLGVSRRDDGRPMADAVFQEYGELEELLERLGGAEASEMENASA